MNEPQQAAGSGADQEPTTRSGVPAETHPIDRRAAISSIAMVGGLAAGYGTFAYMAARFLYPSGPPATGWMFVTEAAAMTVGDSMTYRTPQGASVVVVRKAAQGLAEDFLALSNVCPHLGCKVNWEAANDRFFCPCHNGAFDRSGKAIAGPPAQAGQQLKRFPLKLESGLLYMEVPVLEVAARDRPGHDACLADGAA